MGPDLDDQHTSTMFWKLFKYISGENEDQRKIAMTVPVSISQQKRRDEFEQEMCFYIGEEHQEKTPNPTDPNIYLTTRPEMTIYTRTLGGWMKNQKWTTEETELRELVKTKGLKADENIFSKNGYDAPMKFMNRRN